MGRTNRLGRLSRTLAVGVGVVAVAVVACKPKPRSNPPLCTFKSTNDGELASQSLKPSQWMPIISPAVDSATLERKGPLRDSCGRVLEAEEEPWPACPGQARPAIPRAADSIEPSDIIMGQVGEGRMLVWAATEELATGDVMGPAALVFWTETGLEVHATGALRGLRNETRLRLHLSTGTPVVILEAQQCGSDGRCTTVSKFFPIVARRFKDVPVLDVDGNCLGEAAFPLDKREEQSAPGKLTRRFILQRTVELADDGIYLVDLVTGDEFNPKDPVGTVKPFRRVTARRKLVYVEDHFVLRDRDLWEHVLRDDGLVRPGEVKAKDSEDEEAGGKGKGKKKGKKGRDEDEDEDDEDYEDDEG